MTQNKEEGEEFLDYPVVVTEESAAAFRLIGNDYAALIQAIQQMEEDLVKRINKSEEE